MANYYQTLGVGNSASPADIKTAYRKLSKKFHPDVNDGDKFFEDRFKEIQKAYDVLGSPYGRRKHDAFLKDRAINLHCKNNSAPNDHGYDGRQERDFSILHPFNFFVFILALVALIVLFRYKANNGPW